MLPGSGYKGLESTMKLISAILAVWCISLSVSAGPNINIGTVFDYMDAGQSSYLKRIYNGGNSTAFVRVSILEIIYKADGTSEEVPLQAQGNSAVRDGLIASPARMIVPSRGNQGTRLLFKGARDKERYFRVRFIPVVPEKEDEFAISKEEVSEYKKNLSAGVNVLAGYGSIFIVRPANARFDTKIEDTAQQYSLRNNGNTVIVADELKNCAINTPTECQPVTMNHILPGRVFSIKKEAGRQYRFTLIEGSVKKDIEVRGK